jgi:heme ABC exporter ATP-binding subunit CcmA
LNPSPTDTGALTVKGLSRVYETQYALDRLDASFPTGTVTAVLGPNGAGKSTLVGLLSTLMRPTEGEIWLDGRPVDLDSPSLRARVGYVGHQTMLYGSLTARENLEFFAALYGVEDRARRVDEMLERVGLTDDADRCIDEFSRGMAQRLAIARALTPSPEVVLLDEPFTGLDQNGIELCIDMFLEIKARGAVLVLISHDLSLVQRLADRIIILRRGRKVFEGPLDGPLVDVYRQAQEGRRGQ